MKSFKESATAFVLCIVELITGILLLLDPIRFTSTVIIGTGIVLIVLGLVQAGTYFRTDAETAALGQLLTKGLISVLAGVFCVMQWEWFLAAFPALTIVYGALILITGISKIQLSIDMIRLKKQQMELGRSQCGSYPDMRHCGSLQSLCIHRSSMALHRCGAGGRRYL